MDDKLLDFYIFKYNIEHKLLKDQQVINKETLDKLRQKYCNNEILINLFDKFNFDLTEFEYNKSNKFGDDNKSALIVALVCEIFKKNKDNILPLIKKLCAH